jgi:hypothetical protein
VRSFLTLLVLLPLVAHADVDRRFAKLRDNAEPLSSVGALVDKYVGDCLPLVGGECERNAEAFRKASNGKQYYMIVTETTAGVLSMGEINQREGTFVLQLTPFFSGSNSAVTHGAPTKTDANGNPVMPFIRIDAKFPDGWNPALMTRQVQAQALRLQIVFTPEGLWTLPKKGGGTIKGVKARFEAVLVTVGRTGDQVGLWVRK